MCSLVLRSVTCFSSSDGFEGRDRLSLYSADFHLFLEFLNITYAREEVRLTTTVTVKTREPTIPFPFWSFGFFEIANNRKIFRRKKAVIDNFIVLPAIPSSRNVIIWFPYQFRLPVLVIETRTLNVV